MLGARLEGIWMAWVYPHYWMGALEAHASDTGGLGAAEEAASTRRPVSGAYWVRPLPEQGAPVRCAPQGDSAD